MGDIRTPTLSGLLSVVEDLSQPVQARHQIESAVDHGLHLLLEVARLAETSQSVDVFLGRLAARLAGVEPWCTTFTLVQGFARLHRQA